MRIIAGQNYNLFDLESSTNRENITTYLALF